MKIKFSKMHGLGNDFMVIDAINQSFTLNETILKSWSDRNFGVGFDQLLLVETSDLAEAEFKYRIFNADGSEVGQCGNGARCFARFVVEKGLTANTVIPVETASGLITLECQSDHRVKVNMGPPKFDPELIPLNLPQQARYQLDFEGQVIQFSSLSMGNPHAVIQVDDIANAPVEALGRFIESHELFPQRVNVGFMQVIDRNNIKCRVFERGAGETVACGTGACAAMVAANRLGVVDNTVTVHLRGGQLTIDWQQEQTPVFMTGDTAMVFEGEIDL